VETTRTLLNTLTKKLKQEYIDELSKLPFKPKVRETLIDGFSDGVRNGIQHTVRMLGVTILEK